MATRPPQLARRFLIRFLRHDLAEEVLGDLEEKFYTTIKDKSLFRARLNYWYQVVNYLRPFAIRRSRSRYSNHNVMIGNYLKISLRSMRAEKGYSSIKIGGFALGMAACILIALFVRDELRYDTHYPDAHRIYRVIGVYNDAGEVVKGVHFQPPFAQALADDFIEIEKAGRYNNGTLFGAADAQVRRADWSENLYEDRIVYIDQELVDIFGLPFIHGNPSKALSEPYSIILTQKKAEKYFPDENPLGKSLIINDDKEHPYTVGGVIADLPATSHLQFDLFLTLSGKEFWEGEQTSWCCSNYPTYVLVKEGTRIPDLAEKMTKGVIEKYILPLLIEEGRTDAREVVKKSYLELQPVTDIHLYSEGIHDGGLSHGDIRFVWLFGSVGVFIVVIACINFINLSTARSANRAREVGVRKVVGSSRRSLVKQFLVEALVYSVFSFAIGVLIAALLLPWFNTLAGKSLVMPWGEWWFLPMIGLAAIAVGILAGLYPSFYLSSFKPIQILKGKLARGSRNSSLRSTLVVFQFTTSIILIVATFIIFRQMDFILNKKLGFDKDHVLFLQGTHVLKDKVATFKNELEALSVVESASIGDYLPVTGTKRNGNEFFIDGHDKIDKPVSGQFWVIDEDYLQTMGIKLVAGRNFDDELASDSEAVIINQTMAEKLNLEDPVGSRIMNWQGYNVIGVVEDFHFESLKADIEPLALRLGRSSSIVSVKLKAGDVGKAVESVTALWKKFAPHQPVRYSFLDQDYARMYEDVKRMGRIFTSCAMLAIAVACLGLFGLSAFMAEQRNKEISIRLVLGASVNNILRLLTQNFLSLVLISLVIASPIAWCLMQNWLEDYAYRIEVTWDIFAQAGAIAVVIAVATISYQSVRTALMNPVDSLRSE